MDMGAGEAGRLASEVSGPLAEFVSNGSQLCLDYLHLCNVLGLQVKVRMVVDPDPSEAFPQVTIIGPDGKPYGYTYKGNIDAFDGVLAIADVRRRLQQADSQPNTAH